MVEIGVDSEQREEVIEVIEETEMTIEIMVTEITGEIGNGVATDKEEGIGETETEMEEKASEATGMISVEIGEEEVEIGETEETEGTEVEEAIETTREEEAGTMKEIKMERERRKSRN